MADVRKHAPSSRVRRKPPTPSPRPRSREADDKAVIREVLYGPFDADMADDVDALHHRGPGIQDRVWRRLKRGGYHIGGELDLHGLNREQAYLAVADFITRSRESDVRCIRIIHGKGLRSSGHGPVIRRLLGGWLRRRNEVLAFCPAQRADGGSGATYVLLRAAAR